MNQTWKNHLVVTLTARVPANVEPLIDAIGIDGAARFMLAYGGANLRLPKSKKGPGFQAIADLIGEDAAGRLVDAFGIDISRVPISPSFLVRYHRGQGQSVQQIARLLHRSDKMVRDHLGPGGGDPPARLLQKCEVTE